MPPELGMIVALAELRGFVGDRKEHRSRRRADDFDGTGFCSFTDRR
jgi:hypothetical protein